MAATGRNHTLPKKEAVRHADAPDAPVSSPLADLATEEARSRVAKALSEVPDPLKPTPEMPIAAASVNVSALKAIMLVGTELFHLQTTQ